MTTIATDITVKITVPMPPSVNKLFANVPGKGRVKTRAYRAWIEEAGWEVKRQRPSKVTGRFHISIACKRPDNRRRDVANLEKALTDLLVRLKVIPDDAMAESVTMSWSGGTLGAAEVTIWPHVSAQP